MSSISGLSTSSRFGGRGRGRGMLMIGPEPQLSTTRSGFVLEGTTEDSVDGCALTANRLETFADKFSDDVTKTADSIADTLGCLRLDDGSEDAVVETPTQDKAQSAPVAATDAEISEAGAEERKRVLKVPFTVISVNYEDKRVMVKMGEKASPCKAIVRLNKSPMLIQWRKENQMVLENDTLLEKALLSALELNDGFKLHACAMAVEEEDEQEDLLVLTVELFENTYLRRNFIYSIMFAMVPRLPFNGSKKVGIITNLPEDGGTIDIAFYDHVWRGLREIAHQVQMENKLVTSSCPSTQALFLELIGTFNTKMFLAPFDNNWRELHRVSLMGKTCDSVRMICVRYIDLGKDLTIPIENLVLPVPAYSTPELFEKTPPQAVTYRIDKLVSTPDEHVMRSLAKIYEGRACFIQMVDDSVTPPLVNVFVSNKDGPGTLSLSDVIASCNTLKPPTQETEVQQAPLKVVDKTLHAKMKTWEDSLNKLKNANGIVGDVHQGCILCKNTPGA